MVSVANPFVSKMGLMDILHQRYTHIYIYIYIYMVLWMCGGKYFIQLVERTLNWHKMDEFYEGNLDETKFR